MELSEPFIDWILSEITRGESQADIARSMAIDPSTLSKALSKLRAENAEADQSFVRAREASAEVWLDRGGDVLMQALPKASPLDPGAARAYEQHCARQAAIRNPQFSDRQRVEHAGVDGKPIQFERIERVIVDPANSDS